MIASKQVPVDDFDWNSFVHEVLVEVNGFFDDMGTHITTRMIDGTDRPDQ